MAFNLSGILSLNTKGFTGGLTKAQKDVGGLNGKLGMSGKLLGGLAVAGAGIAVIGKVFVDSTKTFMEFEKKMSNVKAITEETSETAMKQLSEKAKEMGRILPASASDAADAMANLGSAGFTTNEIMKSIEGTLYLAASAQTDMATAADITSGTLRGFGLDAAQANHVADVLSKTSAKTNAGIIDLGEAMKYVAPAAKASGISLEETASAIGIMANAGIKGLNNCGPVAKKFAA